MTARSAVRPLLALLMIATAAEARAQDLSTPRPRQGYYVGLGGDVGMQSSWDHGAALGPWVSSGGTLRLGQMIAARLGLGVRLGGGGAAGDGQTAASGSFALEGQWNPWRDLAIHASTGLGVVRLRDPSRQVDASRGSYSGFHAAAATYDLFLTRRSSGGWALSPVLTLSCLLGDIDAFWLTAGVQLTWWSGLPPAKLDHAAQRSSRR